MSLRRSASARHVALLLHGSDTSAAFNAVDIRPGDQLRGSTGGLLVVQAMHDRGWLSGQTVYNLSVADTHTYYIATGDGNLNALVHNASPRYPSCGWQPPVRIPAGSQRAANRIARRWTDILRRHGLGVKRRGADENAYVHLEWTNRSGTHTGTVHIGKRR